MIPLKPEIQTDGWTSLLKQKWLDNSISGKTELLKFYVGKIFHLELNRIIYISSELKINKNKADKNEKLK